MRDFPEKDFAGHSPQVTNYADYCDALSAERWSRLFDAMRKKRVDVEARAMEWEDISGERTSAISREALPR